MNGQIVPRRIQQLLALLLGLLALAAAVNAWTYSYATGIPLVQSDAWIFLDTYVRKYLVGGFGWRDFFLQAHSSDTNLPLHKLVLLFHINHFNMDFKVEGLIGVASGIALTLLLTVTAAGSNPARWSLAGYGLLAWLALVTLSLNSHNVYTWPLVTMWFLNLLLVALYLVFMARPVVAPKAALAATLLLGFLLDEVALITVLAAVAALLIQRDARPWRDRMLPAAAAVAGLLAVRGLYAWFNASHGVIPEAVSTPGLLQNLVGLISSEALQLVLIPLSDSLLHQAVLEAWYPVNHVRAGNLIGAVLVLAHVWFWWQVFRSREGLPAGVIRTRRVAIALMLFFYGTVAGIALQRIPEFGIEYLHQPRYVVFYQLNLAALGLMAHSVFICRPTVGGSGRLAGGLLLAAVLGLGQLQWHLSLRSWDHAKYLSVYVEGTAATMGRLAVDPDAQIECADILRVCDFPPPDRRRMMDLLQNYQLNIFNPDFQALYRLRPFPAPVPASAPTAPAPAPASDSTAGGAPGG
ncbi:MAG: hypothetical protein ACR2J7_00700 [Luteimonas sp.]